MGLVDIANRFKIEKAVSAVPYGNGHINETYLVKTDGGADYILQKINNNVFKNPAEVMENISAVTEHLGKKIIANGGNPDRETLTLIKTDEGNNFLQFEGGYYRMYKFIANTVSYDIVEYPKQLYYAAKSFGKFQNMLADFPAQSLHETIVNFHNTKIRIENLKAAIKADSVGRLREVANEVDFALSREDQMGVVIDALEKGEIPTRVTHNDTKLNNVLFDDKTDEGVCVIDLDTVMPGSLLYDYGDALRFGGSSGAEDDPNLDNIWFKMNNYEYFTRGFLETLPSITKEEKELLPFSIRLMTYECGIRFLTDYLSGDTYFRIHREKHNLDRTRTQFKLISDMEKLSDEMNKFVSSLK